MKIDFHTHGKLAKKLPFSIPYTNWLFDEAKRAGLDALCLTEHFNTLQFDEVYGYILSISRREGDSLCCPTACGCSRAWRRTSPRAGTSSPSARSRRSWRSTGA